MSVFPRKLAKTPLFLQGVFCGSPSIVIQSSSHQISLGPPWYPPFKWGEASKNSLETFLGENGIHCNPLISHQKPRAKPHAIAEVEEAALLLEELLDDPGDRTDVELRNLRRPFFFFFKSREEHGGTLFLLKIFFHQVVLKTKTWKHDYFIDSTDYQKHSYTSHTPQNGQKGQHLCHRWFSHQGFLWLSRLISMIVRDQRYIDKKQTIIM